MRRSATWPTFSLTSASYALASRPALSQLSRISCHLLHQCDDHTAQIAVGDTDISAQQLWSARKVQEPHRRFLRACAPVYFICTKQPACRNSEYVGNLCETAGADAVYPFLVFLHLLKCQSEMIGKLRLRQAARETFRSDPTTNLHINFIRRLRAHRQLSPSLPVNRIGTLSLFGLRTATHEAAPFSFVRPNMCSMPGGVNVRSRLGSNGISEPNQPHATALRRRWAWTKYSPTSRIARSRRICSWPGRHRPSSKSASGSRSTATCRPSSDA